MSGKESCAVVELNLAESPTDGLLAALQREGVSRDSLNTALGLYFEKQLKLGLSLRDFQNIVIALSKVDCTHEIDQSYKYSFLRSFVDKFQITEHIYIDTTSDMPLPFLYPLFQHGFKELYFELIFTSIHSRVNYRLGSQSYDLTEFLRGQVRTQLTDDNPDVIMKIISTISDLSYVAGYLNRMAEGITGVILSGKVKEGALLRGILLTETLKTLCEQNQPEVAFRIIAGLRYTLYHPEGECYLWVDPNRNHPEFFLFYGSTSLVAAATRDFSEDNILNKSFNVTIVRLIKGLLASGDLNTVADAFNSHIAKLYNNHYLHVDLKNIHALSRLLETEGVDPAFSIKILSAIMSKFFKREFDGINDKELGMLMEMELDESASRDKYNFIRTDVTSGHSKLRKANDLSYDKAYAINEARRFSGGRLFNYIKELFIANAFGSLGAIFNDSDLKSKIDKLDQTVLRFQLASVPTGLYKRPTQILNYIEFIQLIFARVQVTLPPAELDAKILCSEKDHFLRVFSFYHSDALSDSQFTGRENMAWFIAMRLLSEAKINSGLISTLVSRLESFKILEGHPKALKLINTIRASKDIQALARACLAGLPSVGGLLRSSYITTTRWEMLTTLFSVPFEYEHGDLENILNLICSFASFLECTNAANNSSVGSPAPSAPSSFYLGGGAGATPSDDKDDTQNTTSSSLDEGTAHQYQGPVAATNDDDVLQPAVRTPTAPPAETSLVDAKVQPTVADLSDSTTTDTMEDVVKPNSVPLDERDSDTGSVSSVETTESDDVAFPEEDPRNLLLEQTNADLRAKNSELKRRLEEQAAMIEALKAQLAEKSTACKALETQVAEQGEALASSHAQLDAIRSILGGRSPAHAAPLAPPLPFAGAANQSQVDDAKAEASQ